MDSKAEVKIMLPKAVFSWSGGKDSSFALHKVLKENLFDVKYLLTTVHETLERISMHGVRRTLLYSQVKSIGIPLIEIPISEASNEEYEKVLSEALLQVKSQGVSHVIFGDIFLEDLKAYRLEILARVGMKGVFPLWGLPSSVIMRDFLANNFKTVTCCVNSELLSKDWVGKLVDEQFISDLPSTVDPCGENGEYHTFCFDGPIFSSPVQFKTGEKVFKPLKLKREKEDILASEQIGFWYCDLLPNDT